MKTILNGIKNENPTFVLLLGMCPALATTTKLETAYLMGLCVLIVLICSNFIISCIKKVVPENVKIPVFILIIGTIVTVLELLLQKYLPALNQILGIYLPLIVVNCIVLGRGISVASKSSIKESILDAIGIGIGFTLSISFIATIREIIGTNTITIMDTVSTITGYKAIYQVFPDNIWLPNSIFVNPAGAFLTIGFLLAFFKSITKEKKVKHESH